MRSILVENAIKIVAREGLPGLTHRSLAKEAGCALATASYHFPKKSGLIEAVAETVISGYIADLERAIESYRDNPAKPRDMMAFSSRVLRATIGHQRDRTAAWAEIYLDGIRRAESRTIVHGWIKQLHEGWMDVAQVVEPGISRTRLVSTLDLNIGSIFIALALDLSRAEMDRVVNQDCALPEIPLRSSRSVELDTKLLKQSTTPKAQNTRDLILEAAINVIVEDGISALTYRGLASKTGLADTAPKYYYPSISDLLHDAQTQVFEQGQSRFLEAVSPELLSTISPEKLVDLTTMIFQREVLSFGKDSLVMYQIWLEAGRRIELRDNVSVSMRAQIDEWNEIYQRFKGRPCNNFGFFAQALFVGKIVRLLSQGGQFASLLPVREEFMESLTDLLSREPIQMH